MTKQSQKRLDHVRTDAKTRLVLSTRPSERKNPDTPKSGRKTKDNN